MRAGSGDDDEEGDGDVDEVFWMRCISSEGIIVKMTLDNGMSAFSSSQMGYPSLHTMSNIEQWPSE